MKKHLLLIAALTAGLTTAQAQTNLVKNGNFEDVEGLEYDTFEEGGNPGEEGYYNFTRVKEVPGWDTNTGDKNANDCTNGWDGLNKWNVWLSIQEQEPDGDKIVEGNAHFMRLQRYDHNGWNTGTLPQTVTGLTVGHKYRFSLLYRFSPGDYNGSTPEAGYELRRMNGSNEGTRITSADFDETSDWIAATYDFEAKDTSVKIKLFITNPWRADQYNSGVYADFDEVSIVDLSTDGISEVKANAAGNAYNAYYTISGIKVAKPTQAGIYVHQGRKVVVK